MVTKLLLVSGWQSVNIGDIAHTPGALLAFDRLPADIELTLWARHLTDETRTLLATMLPSLKVVEAPLTDSAELPPAVRQLFADNDVLVHSSGPHLVAQTEMTAWRESTGKPYGFFGVTVDPLKQYPADLVTSRQAIAHLPGGTLPTADRELLQGAAFTFCRDSITVDYLRKNDVDAAFSPDATVAFDAAEDSLAESILTEYQLVPGQFLCAVPRQRYTPYYRIREQDPTAEELVREAASLAHLPHELAALRDAVTHWIRRTGQPTLIVPEMSYEVELAQQHLAGTFAADVANKVHFLPRFWGLAEAASVYRKAAAVVSMECHSPLIALAEQVPALYLRQPTDTVKGAMYADLGIGDRLIELDAHASEQAVKAVDDLVSNPQSTTERTKSARSAAWRTLEASAKVALTSVRPDTV